MPRKTLLLLGCLAPFAAGCNVFYLTGKNLVNEPITLAEQLCRCHDLRSDAKVAWQEVRCQYPRCMFSAEFRDGFIDGFSDYLDRGGYANPPAVPPKKYQRNKYLNAEGHALIQDWFLGYQYGVDVALATGQRKFLTVPVLLPDEPKGAPKFNIQRDPKPEGEPLAAPKPVGAQVLPQSPDGTAGSGKNDAVLMSRPMAEPAATKKPMGPTKFSPIDEPAKTVDVPSADRLPKADVPVAPLDAEAIRKLIPIPPPPMGVPMLPDHVPTPSVLDELPMVPANHMFPQPMPVMHPSEPAKAPEATVPEATSKGVQ